MAKQGQHKNDQHDQRKSRGLNNPKQSMTITTGSYKKRETYEQQAREHRDTDPEPQRAVPHWKESTHQPTTNEIYSPARKGPSHRSGSDSNADKGTSGH